MVGPASAASTSPRPTSRRAGDLDVVVGSYDGTVILLENTGSREAPAFVPNDALFKIVTDAGYTHPKPTLADIDGDSDLDLVLGHLDDTLAYFLNTGNATAPRFVADATNPFASLDSGRDSSAPTLSDLDGDKHDRLVDTHTGAGPGPDPSRRRRPHRRVSASGACSPRR